MTPAEIQSIIEHGLAMSAEVKETARWNEPTIRENLRRVKINDWRDSEKFKLKVAGQPVPRELMKHLPRLPLPYEPIPEATGFFDEVREQDRALRSVEPGEWERRVLALPPENQTEIGCLVWWDYFAHRKVEDRWDQLDQFLNKWDYVPMTKAGLIENLVAVGYHPYSAYRRTLAMENEDDDDGASDGQDLQDQGSGLEPPC